MAPSSMGSSYDVPVRLSVRVRVSRRSVTSPLLPGSFEGRPRHDGRAPGRFPLRPMRRGEPGRSGGAAERLGPIHSVPTDHLHAAVLVPRPLERLLQGGGEAVEGEGAPDLTPPIAVLVSEGQLDLPVGHSSPPPKPHPATTA